MSTAPTTEETVASVNPVMPTGADTPEPEAELQTPLVWAERHGIVLINFRNTRVPKGWCTNNIGRYSKKRCIPREFSEAIDEMEFLDRADVSERMVTSKPLPEIGIEVEKVEE